MSEKVIQYAVATESDHHYVLFRENPAYDHWFVRGFNGSELVFVCFGKFFNVARAGKEGAAELTCLRIASRSAETALKSALFLDTHLFACAPGDYPSILEILDIASNASELLSSPIGKKIIPILLKSASHTSRITGLVENSVVFFE